MIVVFYTKQKHDPRLFANMSLGVCLSKNSISTRLAGGVFIPSFIMKFRSFFRGVLLGFIFFFDICKLFVALQSHAFLGLHYLVKDTVYVYR